MIMSLNGKKILCVLIDICNNKYTAMMCTYIFKIEYIIDSCLLKKNMYCCHGVWSFMEFYV